MAFGTLSNVFGAFITDTMNASHALDLDGHTLKLALYNNSQPTNPDRNASAATSAYNTGIWATTYEVTDPTGWPSGGYTLLNKTSTFASNTYTFDASDPSAAVTTGISNAYGCLIYDTQSTTQLNHGICFLAFGGAVSAPSGTLTIQFNAAGIFTIGY